MEVVVDKAEAAEVKEAGAINKAKVKKQQEVKSCRDLTEVGQWEPEPCPVEEEDFARLLIERMPVLPVLDTDEGAVEVVLLQEEQGEDLVGVLAQKDGRYLRQCRQPHRRTSLAYLTQETQNLAKNLQMIKKRIDDLQPKSE